MLRSATSLTQKMFKQKSTLLIALISLFFTACSGQQTAIINFHEHIESEKSVEKLLEANEALGIKHTIVVGSPKQTILFDGSKGFSDYDQNNEVILKVAQKYSEEILPFCTIYWHDNEKLNKLKDCVAKGAKGLKLYNGHGFFYEIPLDDPKMQDVYQYLNETGLPVLFHVNGSKYLKEFEKVLQQYPNMKVVCPHFCLLSANPTKLEQMLGDYPNLYFDISFGYVDYMVEGFERFNKDIDKYRNFFLRNQERLIFGTDAVVTDAAFKDAAWLTAAFTVYKDFLEKETFNIKLSQPKEINFEGKGLALPPEVLQKIYYQNAADLMGIYEE